MLMVADLLADCLRHAGALEIDTLPVCADEAELPGARTAFLAAGLAAVRDRAADAAWVQCNLAPAPENRPGAYARLNAVAREMLDGGRARNFFFVHKEPGLRVRFEAPEDGDREALRDDVARRFAACGGWREAPRSAVYEPERYLFGGSASMPYVHRLFTADSLAWLDHHARYPGPEGQAAAWRLSLLMLREMLAGLGVVGWEHRGVWEAVRENTGRRIPAAARDGHGAGGRAAWDRAAEGIREFWQRPADGMLAAFPEERRDALAERAAAVGAAARRWRAGYFEAGAATTGPRRAAAYAVIFHWNRARMPFARQCLLTDALAGDGETVRQGETARGGESAGGGGVR
ncbi:thiopeptide-type bacteriocin biosynthesis protein [Streptomyces sp. RS10V-4]|uniref:thiopeptide-type bacteriocin biosynthesis protein n=1 Tax=Streptomyces rhizoryzae TaxID=2932493 RepID=UPI002002A076|nr:thiopeptide-type bacteriocin biosynthesis protein [Streptomyces rhizoryzae]MCK7626058.1 thiopeptide-type bacteriocin biosynthesis protein [Streptomyces rhizoryzae]